MTAWDLRARPARRAVVLPLLIRRRELALRDRGRTLVCPYGGWPLPGGRNIITLHVALLFRHPQTSMRSGPFNSELVKDFRGFCRFATYGPRNPLVHGNKNLQRRRARHRPRMGAMVLEPRSLHRRPAQFPVEVAPPVDPQAFHPWRQHLIMENGIHLQEGMTFEGLVEREGWVFACVFASAPVSARPGRRATRSRCFEGGGE